MMLEVSCREVITFLIDYLNDELQPERLAAFEEHFGECDSCRAYLRSYREAIRMARQTLAVPPIQSAESEQIASAILLAVRREGKK